MELWQHYQRNYTFLKTEQSKLQKHIQPQVEATSTAEEVEAVTMK